MALCKALVVPVGIRRFWVELLAALGRCDLTPMLAIGRKNAVETREVDSRLGH